MAVPGTHWDLAPQTEGKHRILKHYLDAWLPIMGRQSDEIYFIDGFAGPGLYAGGQLGSPLVALNAFASHKNFPAQTRASFIFIEEKESRAGKLERILEARQDQFPPNCRWRVLHGVFDERIFEILQQLGMQSGHQPPVFAMIDPFGVSDTPMTAIAEILRNPRAEVYISLMYEALNRFKTTPAFSAHLDSLFGSSTWREGLDIEDREQRRDFYFSLYGRQLKAAGARHVLKFDLYDKGRLVYAVFFGTHHSLGADRMKQAMWRVAPWGDFKFVGDRSGQLLLGIDPDFEPLCNALLARFSSQEWVSYSTLEEFVQSDATDYHSGHIKRALRKLEQRSELEVDIESRAKPHTYPTTVRVRFVGRRQSGLF